MPQLEIYRNNVFITNKKVKNLTEAKEVKKQFCGDLKECHAQHLVKETVFYYSERKQI